MNGKIEAWNDKAAYSFRLLPTFYQQQSKKNYSKSLGKK
jgi:hypothetical protein